MFKTNTACVQIWQYKFILEKRYKCKHIKERTGAVYLFVSHTFKFETTNQQISLQLELQTRADPDQLGVSSKKNGIFWEFFPNGGPPPFGFKKI